ncbi:hypothetical protein GQ55_6G156700 [Panicum hallii var. hallii]|uniref:Uncharacterized protein n=1 Tax=Panicum hallii var. hallii TaxID=1504633 RepID=A0A2T7D6H1_9POAL|nr:hypothetical protein GQ55_6G156700 [Panicum hallii var. hallii]
MESNPPIGSRHHRAVAKPSTAGGWPPRLQIRPSQGPLPPQGSRRRGRGAAACPASRMESMSCLSSTLMARSGCCAASGQPRPRPRWRLARTPSAAARWARREAQRRRGAAWSGRRQTEQREKEKRVAGFADALRPEKFSDVHFERWQVKVHL